MNVTAQAIADALMPELRSEVQAALGALFQSSAHLEALKRKEYLTSAEVEELYGLDAGTLKVWRCKGRGPASVKLEKKVLYGQTALKEYFEARQVRTADAR